MRILRIGWRNWWRSIRSCILDLGRITLYFSMIVCVGRKSIIRLLRKIISNFYCRSWINKHVMKKESLFRNQKYSYKVVLMIHLIQGIIMAGIGTLMCSIKKLVKYFNKFRSFLWEWIPIVGQKASRISTYFLVTFWLETNSKGYWNFFDLEM